MSQQLVGDKNRKLASGKFRLNGRFFDERKLQKNMHRLSLEERVSRPTIARYLREGDIDSFSGEVLYAILVTGFGLDPAQVGDLKVSDIFEIVENGEAVK